MHGRAMGDNQFTSETYVRDMPYGVKVKLGNMLDLHNMWERLALEIPKYEDLDRLLQDEDLRLNSKYTTATIQWIISCAKKNGSSETSVLLSDWGSKNCKVKHLLQALKKARLLSAVECVLEQFDAADRSNSNNASPASSSNNPEDEPSQSEDSNSVRPRAENRSQNCAEEKSEKERQHKVLADPVFAFPQRLPQDLPRQEALQQPSAQEGTKSNHLKHESGAKFSDGNQGPAPAKVEEEEEKTRSPEEATELGHLKEINFQTLKTITNNFNKQDVTEGGNLLGEGGFGNVFLGVFHSGYSVAVKCLKNDSGQDSLRQFVTEVEMLNEFKHENLVYLMGYSYDGETKCLVYQYLPNGSLQDRLACKYKTRPLCSALRVGIAQGTADGLAYLHEKKLTHRDIKSANILLDANFEPKLGDFATARVIPSDMAVTVMTATTVIGSRPYMAPEAFSFKIHPGLDIFSFGVVLLELLTGLPVFDKSRDEGEDLKLLVMEHCAPLDDEDEGEEVGTIFDLLDQKAGQWDPVIVDTLYKLSQRCLKQLRKDRPTISGVVETLRGIQGNNKIEKSSKD